MKLNGASAALAYLVSGISPTVVVSATSTKLRGRHLQDGTPSAIVQEEGNTGDCTIIAQDALMIPKEGERNLQYVITIWSSSVDSTMDILLPWIVSCLFKIYRDMQSFGLCYDNTNPPPLTNE